MTTKEKARKLIESLTTSDDIKDKADDIFKSRFEKRFNALWDEFSEAIEELNTKEDAEAFEEASYDANALVLESGITPFILFLSSRELQS